MNDPFEPDIASLLQTFQLGAGAGNASSVHSHLPASGTSYDDETAMASALVKQTEAARAQWDRERNAPPIPVQLAPKRILLSQMEATRKQSMTSSSEEVKILQTTIGHEANFSVSGLDSLSPVLLRKMRARHVHKGRFLLCRVISRPQRRVGTELAVEDTDGNAVFLALYHFPGLFQATQDILDATLPIGQLLVIREPWMKSPAVGFSHSMIRVDSPSDVIFLSGDEPLAGSAVWSTPVPRPPHAEATASALKALGTAYFKKRLFIPAARIWSLGIQREPKSAELRLNRAQAYILLEWYHAALNDALYVLDLESSSILATKASYRAARAEYGLCRYHEALHRFQTIGQDDTREWETKCRLRIRETEDGDYRWIDMFREGQALVPRLDVAPYTGPIQVELVAGRGGGRGVIASRDVQTGELLAVRRPFASVFPSELARRERLTAINFLTNTMSDTGHLALLYRVVEKLHGNPEAAREIYSLYDGRQHDDVPLPPQDIHNPEIRLETPLVSSVDVDIGRIGAIVTFNYFSPNCVRSCEPEAEPTMPEDPVDGETGKPVALYTLPSFFNHACQSNAVWLCFGDVMVIRANEPIVRGCEITIPYVSTVSNPERANKLKRILEDRACDCLLCAEDREDGIDACRERSRIINQWFQDGRARLAAAGPKGRKIIDGVLAKLDATYQPKRTTRTEQFYVHGDAIDFYQSVGSLTRKPEYHIQAIEHGFRALQRAGLTGIDTSTKQGSENSLSEMPISTQNLSCPMVDPNLIILTMIHISQSFTCIDNLVHARRWHTASQWVHDTIFGGGQELFRDRLGTHIRNLQQFSSIA